MSNLPPLYDHQANTVDHLLKNPRALVFSDAGTGKTRCILEAFMRLKAEGKVNRMIVLGTLSILEPAWGQDIRKWAPSLSYQIVTAKNRAKTLPPHTDADVYVLNHDAVRWLEAEDQCQPLVESADVLCVDECTAFKHRTSARSKAIAKLRKHFEYRWLMTGTPNTNSVLELWHPVFLADDGERLGRAFWGYRAQVCTPEQNNAIPGANHVTWVDKPHAEMIVADRLHDITVRYKFEDCLDIPANNHRTIGVALPPKLMKQYEQMRKDAVLELENGEAISAIHAGAKVNKLLQICSGAVYDGPNYAVLDDARVKLTLDLVEEAEHSVVAFNWRHQRDGLVKEAERRGITYAVIDGETPMQDRFDIVAKYQMGHIRTIFAHPQSAGHGLTLTRGTRTIWCSPTYNAEWFEQFNHRIYRAGQTQATETIMIAADGTHELLVYEKLQDKRDRMFNLLGVFAESTRIAA